jgi:hypothetical protein
MNEAQAVPHPGMLSQGELSKEQREHRRRIEILKNWEIKIHPLDRGCTVSVGCKSVAFDSIDTAMEVVKQYVYNPVAVIKHYGFEDHIRQFGS